MVKKEVKKKHQGKQRPKLTFEQKAADKLTEFVGSWTFIFAMILLIIFWIMINVYMIVYKWDPYPFILLNFVLSCLAALQAPVILMSQNRAAERDRATQKYDYQVDRKSERGIQEIIRDLKKIKRQLKIK